MKFPFPLAGLVGLAALATACGSGEPEPTPTPEPTATPTAVVATVSGTFSLFQTRESLRTPVPLSLCAGRGGYDDIQEGMEVVVSSDGTTLAVGRFSAGVHGDVTLAYEECQFTFEVAVPEGSDFYTVKLGRRGERTYTWDELTTPGNLAFEIGR